VLEPLAFAAWAVRTTPPLPITNDQLDMFEIDLATETITTENKNRAAIIEHPKGLLLAIADGAGGLASGKEAAELVIQIVKEAAVSETEFFKPLRWCNILSQADNWLFAHPTAGETTAVIVALCEGFVCGASVGNSGAFLVQEQTELELTAEQWQKPLIGSGIATPISFGPIPFTGTLVLATDGLIKNAPPEKIRQIVRANNAKNATKALIESVRYPSGNQPDDVTVIIIHSKITQSG